MYERVYKIGIKKFATKAMIMQVQNGNRCTNHYRVVSCLLVDTIETAILRTSDRHPFCPSLLTSLSPGHTGSLSVGNPTLPLGKQGTLDGLVINISEAISPVGLQVTGGEASIQQEKVIETDEVRDRIGTEVVCSAKKAKTPGGSAGALEESGVNAVAVLSPHAELHYEA
ncbi:hypothetical protein BDP27DRAFT_1406790 [Rhodocollybia butyracea]|uniref:Uncharacterized protein n=1 Tax=Rhodocollybia butyracea TaxID=206335 RepID=A0A9P5PDB2_9AGAR|nr:hypothetical protein BDP27DRAFT_1406790 [Rhodocollybia butyracea]